MIRLLDGLPDGVIGLEAIGEVVASDYHDVLDPAVKAALADRDKLRLLYVLGDEFTGYSGGAMWEDTKVGVENWTHWERIAVVSDHKVYIDGVKVFGWLVPGKVKTFAVAELDDARTWVTD